MNPNDQRIAIAEALGWKPHADGSWYRGDKHPMIRGGSPLPDYLNDLNACHEMEKVLDKTQRIIYMARLAVNEGSFTATAAQRCEAFLKTIGKWKDSK